MAEVLQFPLKAGLDEGTNPKSLPPGTLKSGHNIRVDKLGRTAKKYGTAGLAKTLLAGGNVGAAERLIVRGTELCLVDSTQTLGGVARGHLCAYSPGQAKWTKTPMPDVGVTWSNFLDDSRGVKSSDIAISGTLLIHTWLQGDPTTPGIANSKFVRILDLSSGTTLLQPTSLGGDGTMVRVLVLGGYAFILSSDATGTSIRYSSVNLTTFAVGSSVALRTDVYGSGGKVFDACVVGSRVVIAYENSANAIKLYDYSHAAGVLTNVTNGTLSSETGTAVYSISIVHDSSAAKVGLLYYVSVFPATTNGAVRFATANDTTLAESNAPATVESGVNASVALELVSTALMLLTWGIALADDAEPPRTRTQTWVPGTGGTANIRTTAQVTILARPFKIGVQWFLPLADIADTAVNRPPSISSYLAEVELSTHGFSASTWAPHLYVGKIDDAISGSLLGMSHAAVVSSTESIFVSPFQATAPQAPTVWRQGLRLVRVLVGASRPADMFRSVSVGQEAYIQTGIFAAYDGRVVFDYGLRAPVLRSAASSATGGSVANGAYVYQTTPTFRSYAGVTHRGPASYSVSNTVAAASAKVALTLSTHSLDGKQRYANGDIETSPASHILHEVYRSVVNASTPQKLTYEPRFNVIYNDVRSNSLTLSDTVADASIAGIVPVTLASRPVIYTSTGELEDTQPPAPYAVCFHNGRLFVLTGLRREVWWSKDIDENPGLAPGFHPTQRFIFEEDLTTIASLEDKLVFFSDTAIWYVFGDGPGVDGSDNRFSTPRQLPSDVGCTNGRGVVLTPLGLMFPTARGIYLLTRALELVWIGEQIRDQLASFPRITSAVLVADQNEVRFTANNTGATAGRVLVYDYVRKLWLTRAYADDATANTPIADSVVWNGVWTFATPGGKVYTEDTTTCLDGGTAFASQTVGLAPIAAGGTVSWSRVKKVQIAGQSVSNHRVSIAIARNFATSFSQTKTFEAGTDVTTIGPLEKAEVALVVQKTQAVEIQISDAAPTNTTSFPLGTGAGFVLEGVGLLVQRKEGMPKASANRRG